MSAIIRRIGIAILLVILPAGFLPTAVHPEATGRQNGVMAEGETAEKVKRTKPEHTQSNRMNPDLEAWMLERQSQRAINAFQDTVCGEIGLVRYHGKCMKAEERTKLFELEVRHVQSMLHEVLSIYETATPEDVALEFREVEKFMDKFEVDEIMDERIAEKLLLLLAFLHRSAYRLDKEMRRELTEKTTLAELPIFMREHKRTEDFSSQVYVPLIRLLAKHIDAYILRNGNEKLRALLINNSLEDIIDHLK